MAEITETKEFYEDLAQFERNQELLRLCQVCSEKYVTVYPRESTAEIRDTGFHFNEIPEGYYLKICESGHIGLVAEGM